MRDRAPDSLRTPRAVAAGCSVVVLLLGAALVARVLFVLGLPAIHGTDPYVRLYYRDELFVTFLRRDWLPGLQGLVVLAYSAGPGLSLVRWVIALSGAAVVGLAFFYGRIRFGFLFGVAWAVGLYLDPDLLHVTSAPYQEPTFFVCLLASLLLVARLPRKPSLRDCLPALLALGAACSIRYEGLLLGIGLALGMLIGGEPGVAGPRRSQVLVPALAFAGVPLLLYGGFEIFATRGAAVSRGAFSNVPEHAGYLLDFLLAKRLVLLAAGLGLLLSISRRHVRRREILALHVFTLGFVIVYVLWSPYVPLGNRRFHLPLTLWMTFHAALPLHYAAELLRRRSLAAQLAGATPLVIGLTLFLLVDSDGAIGSNVQDLTRQHGVYRKVGEAVDRELGPAAGVVVGGTRGGFRGHPELHVMRIFGYMQGSRARLIFAGNLDGTAQEALADLFRRRDVRGILLSPGDGGGAAEPLRAALRGRGGGIREQRLAGGYRLLALGGASDPGR